MLGFDIDALLASKLAEDNRPPDGLLHPSGDLRGSLRHSQLRAAGAPTIDGDLISSVRMMTGTLWHSYFEQLFRGKPVMAEVTLDKYLPEGWAGRADWVIWSDEMQGFVLGDLKTTKGEGIKWIDRDGIKEEHQWQVSCYWWALYNAGFPMVDEYIVYYLPQNQVIERGSFANVRPLTLVGKPIAEDILLGVMNARWRATTEYLKLVRAARAESLRTFTQWDPWEKTTDLLNEELAPVQKRVVKLIENRKLGHLDAVLVPHWSATYCPYPTELCNCREQKQTKIGHYIGDKYIARSGYEEYDPVTGIDAGSERSGDTSEGLDQSAL